MGPKEKQKIEIEKLHRDHLPPLNQPVTADFSDFLGTALIPNMKIILDLLPAHTRLKVPQILAERGTVVNVIMSALLLWSPNRAADKQTQSGNGGERPEFQKRGNRCQFLY